MMVSLAEAMRDRAPMGSTSVRYLRGAWGKKGQSGGCAWSHWCMEKYETECA